MIHRDRWLTRGWGVIISNKTARLVKSLSTAWRFLDQPDRYVQSTRRYGGTEYMGR